MLGSTRLPTAFSNVLLLAVTGFVLAFGPYVFSIYARDPELEKQVRGKTMTYLIICLTAAALALTLFAQEIISIVAPAFDDATRSVGLLTVLGGGLRRLYGCHGRDLDRPPYEGARAIGGGGGRDQHRPQLRADPAIRDGRRRRRHRRRIRGPSQPCTSTSPSATTALHTSCRRC